MTILILVLPADSVHADPPDMYAQNQSILIEPDGLHIDWKIAPGPVIADATWQAADLNHDGSISQQEAAAWTKPFIAGFSISVDGNPVSTIQTQSIRWPASIDSLRTGQDAIEIQLLVKWPSSLTEKHSIQINNSYFASNSLNWFSLTGEQGFSFDQPAQDNNKLGFDLYFPNSSSVSTPTASSLTSWNSGIPNLPGFTGTISKLAINLAAPLQTQQQTPTAPSGATPFTSALVGLVKTPQLSPLFLIGAFLLSLVLGSLHALTPGHGKTLVGAYLVGSHGKVSDAIFLGAIVTITHTGSVLLLGLLTLLASHFILPSLIAPWLEILSGLLVIGFGLNLLFQRRRDLISWSKKKSAVNKAGLSIQSATAIGPHNHGAGLPHTHSHSHDSHTHEHTHGGSGHEHSHALPNDQVTWKSLLALGVSGGLVPCPDAIAILLVAVAINRIPLGMLLIFAFSIGLALILIAIGIAMVQGMRFVTRSDILNRFSVYTPIISAMIVLGLGFALTINAVNSFRFSTTVLTASNSNTPASAASQSPSAAPTFTVKQMRLLYVAADSQGHDQLFSAPLSGGAAIQYTQEPSGIVGYSLSPDQHTILYTVFEQDNSTSIWAINSEGSQKWLVLKCPQTECGSLQWYPDSQKIVYERLEDSQDSALARFSIWWLDVSTGQTHPVFQDQAFPSTAAKFSPDGQWLSYISPATNTLTLYRLKNGHSISLSLNSQQIIPESWGPAGDSLIFGAPATSQDGAPLHIQRYILDSAQTIDLGSPNGASDYSASWSPDGNWIAIDRDIPSADGSTPNNQVWLVKPDGTQAHTLLAEAGASYSDITWTPDGKSILYSQYSYQNISQNGGEFDIYQTDIRTGNSTKLISGGDYPTLLP